MPQRIRAAYPPQFELRSGQFPVSHAGGTLGSPSSFLSMSWNLIIGHASEGRVDVIEFSGSALPHHELLDSVQEVSSVLVQNFQRELAATSRQKTASSGCDDGCVAFITRCGPRLTRSVWSAWAGASNSSLAIARRDACSRIAYFPFVGVLIRTEYVRLDPPAAARPQYRPQRCLRR